MKPTSTLKQKYALFLQILIPILITQVTMSLMTFFDTVMSGHASPADLAGAAVGSSLWVPIQTGLSGILMAVTPVISHLIGEGHKDKVAYQVMQGLMLAVVVGLVVILAGALLVSPILNGMHLTPKVHHVAFYFLTAMGAGVLPLFGYVVLRSSIDALGQTRISMVITLASLPINVAANYVLIFGKFGFPKLGGIGSGVASAFTYWCIFILALFIVRQTSTFREFNLLRKGYQISLAKWKELLKIGVPIGFAIFFETAVFAAVTLLMSGFDTITIAAHQSAINFASTLYMIPLSICSALTILVGYETGASRLRDAKLYGRLGVISAALLSLITAAVLMIVRQDVAELYSTDNAVIAMTKHFLIYAIFFQISDAIATPVQGVLRGYKDVNSAFWITLLSYWGAALPLGFVLSKYTELGPYGYWVGLITGLAIAAVLLLFRLRKVEQRQALRLPS
ncbi:MATE family efflux transporter [Paenibacillus yonginensis]|uniref:Probable multidrug resistance protein NorM n=1 Tax=Paenibacillus yonginensis TaxID=1462996 RepID=A0A1B1MXC5_9BACL|nr:MATE family efflux transporter [Paenibacillus yonginensis]ANS73834.1 MATE family efflux transporter [Paenibacillus yonginensis]